MEGRGTDNDTANEDHPNTKITLRNQKTSPLLRLPAELRNNIYQLVFEGRSIASTRDDFQPCVTLGRTPLRTLNISLLFTCRQTYSETRLIPFAVNPMIGFLDLPLGLIGSLTGGQIDALSTVHLWAPPHFWLELKYSRGVVESERLVNFKKDLHNILSLMNIDVLVLGWKCNHPDPKAWRYDKDLLLRMIDVEFKAHGLANFLVQIIDVLVEGTSKSGWSTRKI
ncbi:hypothetical protein NX059_003898 [Plenodomus lindquistii]|nr:hypothetical protein NX059_003898 [Plenodomus lindquistii]